MPQSQPDSGWIYQCDDIVIEPRAHRLERAGVELSVEPKAYAVLVTLLQQAGDVVGKDDLLDAAWGHRHVTPGVLTRAISQLRHALGDCAGHPRYIATVHSLGYRFIGEVQRIPVAETPGLPLADPASREPSRDNQVAPTSAVTPSSPTVSQKPAAAHWLAAAITLAVIVAMLAAASLWHSSRTPLTSPRISPRPALAVMPLAHYTDPRTFRSRHWPRYRRIATASPAQAPGYLILRPEHAPAAQQ
jgi:DNA-binding winged helix-turn-helix (wHTH) protein